MATRKSKKSKSGDPAAKKLYVVTPGHTLTRGVMNEETGENALHVFKEGEEIELTDAEALDAASAVELEAKRARPGQITRLQARIAELEAQLAEKTADDEAAESDSPERTAAIASIRNRGDNFRERREPAFGSVPATVTDTLLGPNPSVPADIDPGQTVAPGQSSPDAADEGDEADETDK